MSRPVDPDNIVFGEDVQYVEESNNGRRSPTPDPTARSSYASLPRFSSFLQKAKEATSGLTRKASKVLSRPTSPTLSNENIQKATEASVAQIEDTHLYKVYNAYVALQTGELLIQLKKETKRLGMENPVVQTVRLIAEEEGNEKAILALGGSFRGGRRKPRKTLKKRRAAKRKLSRRK